MLAQRQQLHLLSNKDIDDEDWYIDCIPDFHRGYKRPELVDDEQPSDYIKIRLLIARMKALEAARKIGG